MGVFDFIKRFFRKIPKYKYFKKTKRSSLITKDSKIKQPLPISEDKQISSLEQQPLFQEDKQISSLEQQPLPISENKQFSSLIQNIEIHREELIREKKEREIKDVGENEEGFWFQVDKKLFLFDKEGYDLFKEEFNKPPYEIIVSESSNGIYLVRENKNTGKTEYFHRFLFKKEIEDFCLDNDCNKNKAVVHHINFCASNNKRENLQVISENEHNLIHNRCLKSEE